MVSCYLSSTNYARSFWLLHFTPSPLADFEVCCLGELGVCGMFVAGIHCLAKGLIFEFKREGCEF